MANASVHVREEGRGTRLSEYWPLACLVGVSALAGWAIAAGAGDTGMRGFMHGYMGSSSPSSPS